MQIRYTMSLVTVVSWSNVRGARVFLARGDVR